MPLASPITVAVIEDNIEFGVALIDLLETVSDIEVVSNYPSAEEALAEIAESVPAVVLMDLRLPGMNGVECARELKRRYPAMHVMMYTAFDNDEELFESLRAGASGYLVKRSKPDAVVSAIRDLHAGGSPMSPGIARRVVQYFQNLQRPAAAPEQATMLSPREEEVVKLLAKGLRYKEIADELGLSVTTVRTHLGRIYDKLQVSSRTEAVVKFLGRQ